MILYRIQISSDQDWVTSWYPLQALAKLAFTTTIGKLPKADVYLDEIDVPTGKVGDMSGRDHVANALNCASVDRTTWPGKELMKRVAADEEITEDFVAGTADAAAALLS